MKKERKKNKSLAILKNQTASILPAGHATAQLQTQCGHQTALEGVQLLLISSAREAVGRALGTRLAISTIPHGLSGGEDTWTVVAVLFIVPHTLGAIIVSAGGSVIAAIVSAAVSVGHQEASLNNVVLGADVRRGFHGGVDVTTRSGGTGGEGLEGLIIAQHGGEVMAMVGRRWLILRHGSRAGEVGILVA